MKCYNCGDDADMKVLVMINGQLKQVEICSNCYKEQMGAMIDQFKSKNGEFDPEEMQKFMYKILMENKDGFEKIFGNMLDDSNFNLDNIDLNDISYEFQDGMDPNAEISELESFLKNSNSDFQYKPKHRNPADDDNDGYNQMDFNEFKNKKEIKMLKSSVDKKKQQIHTYVASEDYMAAATLRDQIRDINKRIMIIMELEKENER